MSGRSHAIPIAAALLLLAAAAHAQVRDNPAALPNNNPTNIPLSNTANIPYAVLDRDAQQPRNASLDRITGQRATHSALLSPSVRARIEATPAAAPTHTPRPTLPTRRRTTTQQPAASLLVDLSAPAPTPEPYPTPSTSPQSHTLGSTFGPTTPTGPPQPPTMGAPAGIPTPGTPPPS